LVPGVVRISAGATGFEASENVSPSTPPDSLIEIITAPRNPDGFVNFTASTRAKFLIHDSVFYWPSFTPDTSKPINVPLTLFSLSKLAGLSGSRLGWAFVKDRAVADAMADYIYYATHGITVDAQYRAINILKDIADDGGLVIKHVRDTLKMRWDWIKDAFSKQTPHRFTIAGADGFPVIWIKCNDFNVREGCVDVFGSVGIKVRGGGEFGALGYVRMNMMVHSVTWSQVQDRIKNLLRTPQEKMDRLIEKFLNSDYQAPRFSS